MNGRETTQFLSTKALTVALGAVVMSTAGWLFSLLIERVGLIEEHVIADTKRSITNTERINALDRRLDELQRVVGRMQRQGGHSR